MPALRADAPRGIIEFAIARNYPEHFPALLSRDLSYFAGDPAFVYAVYDEVPNLFGAVELVLPLWESASASCTFVALHEQDMRIGSVGLVGGEGVAWLGHTYASALGMLAYEVLTDGEQGSDLAGLDIGVREFFRYGVEDGERLVNHKPDEVVGFLNGLTSMPISARHIRRCAGIG